MAIRFYVSRNVILTPEHCVECLLGLEDVDTVKPDSHIIVSIDVLFIV